jgi:hypothetical protein
MDYAALLAVARINTIQAWQLPTLYVTRMSHVYLHQTRITQMPAEQGAIFSVMSAGRAVIRLWVFGTVFWLGVWGWSDLRKCIVAPKGVLFCPVTLSGDTLLRTDYFHALSFVFGPPLVSLIGGLACWWVILRLRRQMEPE